MEFVACSCRIARMNDRWRFATTHTAVGPALLPLDTTRSTRAPSEVAPLSEKGMDNRGRPGRVAAPVLILPESIMVLSA
jgi:hypothetical protein